MIARIWHGWAPADAATVYETHYKSEVAEKLRAVPGFHGGRLLRRDEGDEVQFTSITYFSSIADIRAFAGPAYRQAVVDDAARAVLTRWDEQAAHHDIAVDLPDPSKP
jgi:heme-degrading monooxygenase HmoA